MASGLFLTIHYSPFPGYCFFLPARRIVASAAATAIAAATTTAAAAIAAITTATSATAATTTIFSWPGLGRITFDALLTQDQYLVLGSVMMASLVLILGNLVADFLLAIADPRIAYD